MENNDNNQSSKDAAGAQQEEKTTKITKKKIVSGYGPESYGSYGSYGGYGNYYGGGYGYGSSYYGSYGGYGSYGAPGGQGEDSRVPNRSLRDYMVVLREHFWYMTVVFFIVFISVVIYTFRVTPVYTSVATVQVLRDSDNPVEGPGSAESNLNNKIVSMEDFYTQVKLLESFEVVKAVRSRMKDEDVRRFMAPYRDMISFGVPMTEEELLYRGRKIMPERMTLIIRIAFSHPDNRVAAELANLFAREYIAFNHNMRVQKLLNSIDELRVKVTQQEAKVKEIDKKMVEYREKNGAVSLDDKDDIDRHELNEINTILVNDKRVFDAASTQWNLVQQYRRDGRDLCDIPFIADLPVVSKLVVDRSSQKVYLAGLEKRYKEKHPKMMEARKAMDQVEKELAVALDSAFSKTKTAYDNARYNYEQSLKRLNDKKDAIISLGQKAIAYKSMEREKQVAEGMHQSLIASMNVRTAQVSLLNENANIIDVAGPSLRPSSPNYVLNIIAGLFAGVFCGVGVAFLFAFLDDRAKNAYDIEAVVGIPLLGVVPRIKRLTSSEKARVAVSGSHRAATESFRSLCSTLKVNNLSKNAKVVLFTSMTPSEGKSFVASNLAQSFAMNGEKTVIIDADLRLPTVAKILNIDSENGLIGYAKEGKSLDDSMIRDFVPNLDVLICEKRAKNPTQILNSAEFVSMLAQFREKYDRIFIDSPPIGAVSDAIALLPSVDGVVLVVKFNSVKRRTIRNHVRRLMESNVPVLGAVMNMMNTGSASAYRMDYYNKSYDKYYTAPVKDASKEGNSSVK